MTSVSGQGPRQGGALGLSIIPTRKACPGGDGLAVKPGDRHAGKKKEKKEAAEVNDSDPSQPLR